MLREERYLRISHNVIGFELYKKFEGTEFNDLFELATRPLGMNQSYVKSMIVRTILKDVP